LNVKFGRNCIKNVQERKFRIKEERSSTPKWGGTQKAKIRICS